MFGWSKKRENKNNQKYNANQVTTTLKSHLKDKNKLKDKQKFFKTWIYDENQYGGKFFIKLLRITIRKLDFNNETKKTMFVNLFKLKNMNEI